MHQRQAGVSAYGQTKKEKFLGKTEGEEEIKLQRWKTFKRICFFEKTN